MNNYTKTVEVEIKMIVKDVPSFFPSPLGCTVSIIIAEREELSVGKQKKSTFE